MQIPDEITRVQMQLAEHRTHLARIKRNHAMYRGEVSAEVGSKAVQEAEYYKKVIDERMASINPKVREICLTLLSAEWQTEILETRVAEMQAWLDKKKEDGNAAL